MNKKTLLTVVFILGGFLLLILLIFLFVRNSGEAKGMIIEFSFLASILLLILGLLLIFSKPTRLYGVGVLISSLTILIIGIGVCTASFKI